MVKRRSIFNIGNNANVSKIADIRFKKLIHTPEKHIWLEFIVELLPCITKITLADLVNYNGDKEKIGWMVFRYNRNL